MGGSFELPLRVPCPERALARAVSALGVRWLVFWALPGDPLLAAVEPVRDVEPAVDVARREPPASLLVAEVRWAASFVEPRALDVPRGVERVVDPAPARVRFVRVVRVEPLDPVRPAEVRRPEVEAPASGAARLVPPDCRLLVFRFMS